MRALYLNTTLTPSPDLSHCERLIDRSRSHLEAAGIATESRRIADLGLATGLAERIGDDDGWPTLYRDILDSEILVIASPIWIGNMSSLCLRLLERLYGMSGETNDAGQSIYYNIVAGVLVTGNEDGAKHVSRDLIYALGHLGFTVPPQAEAYWVGEAGPGPSYGDDGAGFDNDFTNTNTRIMSWNLVHFARMLAERPIPAEGNRR